MGHEERVGLHPDGAQQRNEGHPPVELPHRAAELAIRSLTIAWGKRNGLPDSEKTVVQILLRSDSIDVILTGV